MPKQIKSYNGKVCNLSDEIYVLHNVGRGGAGPRDYGNGTLVRLISGVDKSPIPGYHFSKGWVTVCRVGVRVAEFVGFRRSQVLKADKTR